MITKPLKRNKNILILSREHHLGLLFCWKIRQGIKKNIELERIKKYVRYFWNNHLHKHFEEEEEHLFLKVMDDKCTKAIKQHQELRLQFKQMAEANVAINYDQLSELAESLDVHIRFEERELFPHLEKTIPEYELRQIGILLKHSHRVIFKDNFPDEFWA